MVRIFSKQSSCQPLAPPYYFSPDFMKQRGEANKNGKISSLSMPSINQLAQSCTRLKHVRALQVKKAQAVP
jgi:hypothetical protein